MAHQLEPLRQQRLHHLLLAQLALVRAKLVHLLLGGVVHLGVNVEGLRSSGAGDIQDLGLRQAKRELQQPLQRDVSRAKAATG